MFPYFFYLQVDISKIVKSQINEIRNSNSKRPWLSFGLSQTSGGSKYGGELGGFFGKINIV